MHARSVVGGSFIKLLSDPAIWKKWASRDKLKPANWAPLPEPPRVKVLVPLEQTWRYTTAKPGEDWTKRGCGFRHSRQSAIQSRHAIRPQVRQADRLPSRCRYGHRISNIGESGGALHHDYGHTRLTVNHWSRKPVECHDH
jgi:hypothetical protein